ncbi:general substrate transporter [Hyaloscypha variabilis]
MFGINFREHKWAVVYCGVSTLGALCYGYDQIYYTGVQGMRAFINDYGTTTDLDKGLKALTTSFLSLTASIIYVGELVGALLAAPINDLWGRKAVFFCASCCIIAGAIVQVADNGSEGLIIFGRILIGLGIGQFTVTCVLYIGEVAPKAIRGPALMMFQMMQSCSQLVGSGITQGTEAIASTAAFRIPMGLLNLLPLLMLVGLLIIPESPTWYMSKDRNEKREQEAQSTWSSLLRDPIERRKLTFACGAMVAQQINGIQFFYSYGVVFAQSIGIAQPFTISLITNVLQVIACLAAVLLGNKVPRRINLIVTTIMMFCAFLVVGGLGTHKVLSNGFSVTIVVFSYIIICAFNFGLGPLAFAAASEMSTGRNRNKIMSCAIVTFFFTVWVISFTSPYLYYSANLGPMLGFIYAGTTCITLAYVWFCVGGATGRSNLEIELFFQQKVPVRQWKNYQFDHSVDSLNSSKDEEKAVLEVEEELIPVVEAR